MYKSYLGDLNMNQDDKKCNVGFREELETQIKEMFQTLPDEEILRLYSYIKELYFS